jgi:hypothetical protein
MMIGGGAEVPPETQKSPSQYWETPPLALEESDWKRGRIDGLGIESRSERPDLKYVNGNKNIWSDERKILVSGFEQDGFVSESESQRKKKGTGNSSVKGSKLKMVSHALQGEFEDLQRQYHSLSQFSSVSPDIRLDHSITDRMQDLIEQVPIFGTHQCVAVGVPKKKNTFPSVMLTHYFAYI